MSSSNTRVLKDESDLNALYDTLEAELLHDPIEVTWGKPETRRTKLQHNWYFEIVSQICEATGFNKEALHVWFKKEFLGLDPQTIWGDQLNVTKSTKNLTVKEMSAFISEVEAFCSEKGIELIYPNYWEGVHK